MYRALSAHVAALNVHGDAAGPYIANARVFEAAGVGACVLADHKDDLSHYFSPGTEVLDFRSIDDALDKARWMLRHPRDCAEIGSAAQKRVLCNYTVAHRMAELAHRIERAMAGR